MNIFSKKSIRYFVLMSVLITTISLSQFDANFASAITFSPTIIPNPFPGSNSEFGHAVTKVNSNFAVGVPLAEVPAGSNSGAGQVYIFDGSDGSHILTLQPPSPSANLNFGESISGVGNTDLVVVGTPNGGASNEGILYIYDTTTCDAADGTIDSFCNLPDVIISNPDSGSNDQMGSDKIVSISDTNFLVGVSQSDLPGLSNAGVVYEFDTIGTLVDTYHLGASAEIDGFFGSSVSDIDGLNFLVGSYGADVSGSNESGKAFVMDFATGSIVLEIPNPSSQSASSDDRFGWSVEYVGNSYVVAAPRADTASDNNIGAFYLFDENDDALPETSLFNFLTPDSGDEFGFWLAAINNQVLVGAPFDDSVANDAGEAYLYTTNPSPGFAAELENPSVTAADDEFGFSVDILNSGILVIGAPGDNGPSGPGVVYYFTPDPGPSAILVISSDDPDGIVQPGIPIAFDYDLTNNGNTNFDTTSVTDPDCSPLTLVSGDDGDGIFEVGETWNYQCTRTTPTSNFVESASVDLTAGFDSFNCFSIEIVCNSLPITVSVPSMTLTGLATPDTIPSGGSSVVDFTVTNTGNAAINAQVTTNVSTSVCDIMPNVPTLIPAGNSQVFSCTVTPASTVTITGSATAIDIAGAIVPPPPDVPITITVGTNEMSMTVVPEDFLLPPLGSTNVDFTVFNDGGLPLTGVTVETDAASQGMTCVITPASPQTIPVGQSQLFECLLTVVTGDETLTATAMSVETPDVVETVDFTIASPAITIQNIQQNPNPGAPPPSTVELSWEIINSGNISVSFPNTDTVTGCTPVGPAAGEDANANGLLDIGETFSYSSCDQTFSQKGNIEETILAASQDKFGQLANAQVTFDVIIDDPIIGMTISANPSNPAPDEDVTLTFTIDNNGNVDVDGLFVDVDSPYEACDPPFDENLIVPVGGSASETCVITAPSVPGTFTVTGTGHATGVVWGVQVTDTASIDITVEEPISDITLVSIIRDFSNTHPDMQQGCGGGICNGVKMGLVQDDIGLDDKPIFNQDIDSTNGPVNFNQWYNYIPNVNQCIDYNMVLEFDEQTNTYSFLNGGISGGFFPIDDFGFGTEGFTDNNGVPHNYHFTLQAKGTFDHLPGQFFDIGGADDDVFVFINGKLAIDLGGTHPASQAMASLDLDDPITQAKLGIIPGQQGISFDIFFAERQTFQSHLDISTNIAFVPVSLGQCDVSPNTADLSIEKTGELVPGGSSSVTLERQVSASSDDAEEEKKGDMDLDSSDLDMNEKEFVGLRFNGIDIPQGATITNAYVQFTVEDENGDTGKAGVKIFGEDIGNAPTFTNNDDDISDRDKTSAKVKWDIPNWYTQGQSGPAQATPDLSDIIQEIVDRNDWSSGNSLVLIIEEDKGNKDRDAVSYDNEPNQAPVLIIEYDGGIVENEIIYSITINNYGPEDATTVQVIDNLPEEVTANSVEPIPECEIVDDHTVECDFGSLNVGEEEIITIIGTVEQGTTGTITNIATVSSTLLDPNPTNDQATEETIIGGGGELFCGKPEESYNRIDGTSAKETIVGTHGDDLIFGYGGNDKILGLKGNDCIFGGEGNDTINGNQGNDEIHGGEGKDRLRGNHGNDKIFGENNDDRLYGGHGNDYLDGGAHDKYDRCVGGSGIDTSVNCEKETGIENHDDDDDDNDDD